MSISFFADPDYIRQLVKVRGKYVPRLKGSICDMVDMSPEHVECASIENCLSGALLRWTGSYLLCAKQRCVLRGISSFFA
jgi:hypothetical protein